MAAKMLGADSWPQNAEERVLAQNAGVRCDTGECWGPTYGHKMLRREFWPKMLGFGRDTGKC